MKRAIRISPSDETARLQGAVCDAESAKPRCRCGQGEQAYSFENGTYVGETVPPPPQSGLAGGDLNGDCVVDLGDLDVLNYYWLTRCRFGPECGDADYDFRVNLSDYCVLAGHWLESVE